MRLIRLLILALLTIIGPSLVHAGFLVTKTPMIKGRVTDAAMGNPIESAIVVVQWYRGILISDGPGATELGKPLAVTTDKNGQYEIKSHLWWTPFGFQGCRIQVIHPAFGIIEDTPIYEGNFSGYMSEFGRADGTIVRDFSYGKDKWAFGDEIVNYFIFAKQLGIPYDLNSIFAEWDKKFGKNRTITSIKDEILSVIKRDK